MSNNNTLGAFFEQVKKLKDQGKDIVELNVGDPQVPPPEDVIEKTSEAMWKEKTHYVLSLGCEELRKMIASRFGVEKENVAVSAGARVILNTVFSLVGAKEKIMIPRPYYPPFKQIADFDGKRYLFIDTIDDDFGLTAEAVAQKIEETEIPKFLIVNSPHNPTGKVYPREEMEKLARLSREKGFTIISDECYRHFSEQNYSFRNIDSEAVVVDSCSKTYAMSGWRVGWTVAPPDIIQGIKDYLAVRQGSACSFAQEGAIEAIEHNRAINDFSRERELICDWLKDMNIPCPEPEGGFYVFPDVSKFLQGDIANTRDLAVYLLEQAGVAVAPGEAFGEFSGRIRISYCLDEKKLKEGLERIKTLLNK